MSERHVIGDTRPTMGALPTLPRTAGPGEVSAAIDDVGAVIVEGLVDASLLGRLRDDLAPWVERTPAGSRSADPEWEQFHGRNTVRVNGIAAKTSTFVDVCLDDTILGVADRRLIPDGGATQINDTQLIAIGPGEPAQYLHRDQTGWPWFNQLLPDGPEITVIAMVALTDCTAANGATRIVPGSHLRPDSDDLFDPAATIPAEMSAGSVLLFSGKTVHGGGANHTDDQWRQALHISYLLGWLRPEEAHAFSVPWAMAATLPRRAQELLGFAEYNPAPHGGGRLWLVDFEDPARLFDHPDGTGRLDPANPDSNTSSSLSEISPAKGHHHEHDDQLHCRQPHRNRRAAPTRRSNLHQ